MRPNEIKEQERMNRERERNQAIFTKRATPRRLRHPLPSGPGTRTNRNRSCGGSAPNRARALCPCRPSPPRAPRPSCPCHGSNSQTRSRGLAPAWERSAPPSTSCASLRRLGSASAAMTRTDRGTAKVEDSCRGRGRVPGHRCPIQILADSSRARATGARGGRAPARALARTCRRGRASPFSNS